MVTYTERAMLYSNLHQNCLQAPDKEDIIVLSSPVENLLKSWPLLRAKTAAYAIFIRATTGSHLVVWVRLVESTLNQLKLRYKEDFVPDHKRCRGISQQC